MPALPMPGVLGALAPAVAATMLLGCAAPKVETSYVVPAINAEASAMKRVAVLPFGTLHGSDVTGDVETLLAGVVINDKRYFDVVERQRLEAVLGELKLGFSGVLDDRTASKLGKMLAANGMYMGRVSRAEWSDQRFTEGRQVCVQYEQKRDKKGNLYEGGCQRWQNAQAHCAVRTAIFEFAPKLVSVQTGAIVYSRSHAGEAKAKACSEPGGTGSQSLTDGSRLLADARLAALESFRRDVAPSVRTRAIEMLDSTDHIASPEAKERFKGAIAFARGQRLDRACEIWQEISTKETKSPDLTFNLGVCAETSGQLDRALALYATADRLLTAPNKTIGDALLRVRKDQQDRAKVEAQLRR